VGMNGDRQFERRIRFRVVLRACLSFGSR